MGIGGRWREGAEIRRGRSVQTLDFRNKRQRYEFDLRIWYTYFDHMIGMYVRDYDNNI